MCPKWAEVFPDVTGVCHDWRQGARSGLGMCQQWPGLAKNGAEMARRVSGMSRNDGQGCGGVRQEWRRIWCPNWARVRQTWPQVATNVQGIPWSVGLATNVGINVQGVARYAEGCARSGQECARSTQECGRSAEVVWNVPGGHRVPQMRSVYTSPQSAPGMYATTAKVG